MPRDTFAKSIEPVEEPFKTNRLANRADNPFLVERAGVDIPMILQDREVMRVIALGLRSRVNVKYREIRHGVDHSYSASAIRDSVERAVLFDALRADPRSDDPAVVQGPGWDRYVDGLTALWKAILEASEAAIATTQGPR